MATHEGNHVTESNPTPESTSESTTPATTAAAGQDAAPAAAPRKSSGGLGGKVLAELQEIAAGLGIENIQGMRKGALIDAIKEARGDAPKAAKPAKSNAEAARSSQEDGTSGRSDAA